MSFKKIFYQTISFFKHQRVNYTYNNKIENLLNKNKTKPLTQETKAKIKNRFAKYEFNKISMKWHRFYNSLHDDLILVEFNSNGQEVNFHQMANGPLFGKYTDEILSISKKHNPLDRYFKFGK